MSIEDQIQDLWKAHHKSNATLVERINELEAEQRETDAIVRGPDGTNGLRSRVVKLEGTVGGVVEGHAELRSELRHYLDAERLATCHGIAALDEHVREHKEETKEETEVNLKKMEGANMMWVQIIQLAGIIAVALIGLLK